MIIDAQCELSDAQAVTATAVSENTMDLGFAGNNIGNGQPLYLCVSVAVAMTDSGSDSTVAVTLVDDDNAALSSAATVETIGTFAATSAAGTRLYAAINPEIINQRYLGVTYTVSGGNLTTGSFDAFITTDVDTFTAFASGYSVS